MIIVPPEKKSDKLEEERNVFDETEIYEEMSHVDMDPTGGLRLEPDQYIIDPDYQELLGITDFEDLIKTRR
jgi:hypothetical protein